METGKSTVCNVWQQAADPGEMIWNPEAVCLKIPFCWGDQFSVLCRPSTDWMRPTHIMGKNLLTQNVHIKMLT